MPLRTPKTILITGGYGFIGSNYLNKYPLLYPEYTFINIDCVTYAANPNNIKISEAPNYHFKNVDIRNLTDLEKVFIEYHPTHIIHFAAESHVDMSISHPSIFVETNVLGTHNLLSLGKKYAIQRFHQVSTDEVYGSLGKNDSAFTTTSPIAPNSPYSASKASADLMVRAYHKTYGLDAVITRCSNNYGPFQDKTKLIPKTITNLLADKKVPLYGTGDNIRDWIYVEDHIDAIDTVFHKGTSGSIYNVGGEMELRNIDLIEKLIELTGKTRDSIEFVGDRLGHDFRYAIDNSQIHSELGWQPRVTLEEGLKRTVAFYRHT